MVVFVAMLFQLLMKCTIFSILLVSISSFSVTGTDSHQKKIKASIAVTDKILSKLSARWQIQLYPQFLRSAEISLSSWDVLKAKFQIKILTSLMAKTSKPLKKISNKFVVSFLGSSVTAGHASDFNVSVSEMTRLFMKPAFDAAGIQLEVNNGAMGNNPCLPYDLCVKAFAGREADIIQWEQVHHVQLCTYCRCLKLFKNKVLQFCY